MKYGKAALAGSLLLAAWGVPLAGAEPSSAATPIAVPISAPIAVPISAPSANVDLIRAETIAHESATLKADIVIPVFRGLKDKLYERQLNETIRQRAQGQLAYWEQESAAAAERLKEGGHPVRPYVLYILYDLKSDGGGAAQEHVSLQMTTYAATGGTSSPQLDFYNFLDRETAVEITLGDLYDNDAARLKAVEEEIARQIELEPQNYFADAYEGLAENQGYYVEGDEVVVVFPKYAIAPGVMGTPEFRLPLPGAAPEIAPQRLELMLTAKEYISDEYGMKQVPVRTISEFLGFRTDWIEGTRSVEFTRGPIWTSITEGADRYFSGRMSPRALGAAPEIGSDDKMYVPLSFVTEILGGQVRISEIGTLYISAKEM